MRAIIGLMITTAVVLSGCAEPTPRAIIHQYQYQAVPPVTPGGVPVVPPGPPQPAQGKTVYPKAPFSDPTVVIFRNIGGDTLYVSIDGNEPIILSPGEITTNENVGPGEHTARWWGVVETTHPNYPVLKSREQILFFWVQAEGRTQVFSLSLR
ncbi:MAG: hypothetical protein Q8R35_03270 [bacterium]|nr:hypothetical protein [bacterium]